MKNQRQQPKGKPSSSAAKPPPSDPKPPLSDPKPAADPLPSSPPPPTSSSPLRHLGGGAAPPLLPPAYGFHMLERRTIVLADGSVRSYFALPPDYPMDPSADRFFPYGGPVPGRDRPLGPPFDRHFPPISPDGPSSLKRKFGEEDELARRRQHVAQYGNPNTNPNPNTRSEIEDFFSRGGGAGGGFDEERAAKNLKVGGSGYGDEAQRKDGGDAKGAPADLDIDPDELMKAFLKYSKILNENPGQKRTYLEDGRNGRLSCTVCGRPSKDISDVHRLIVHAYTCPDSRLDHLGLHKALCVLMGWNYTVVPDDGKAYQLLSAKDAAANRDDLILWPPHVIMYNTSTGKRGKDGRVEGMGNKEMDNWLREAGFGSGKGKSIFGKEGHLGVTLVKFPDNEAGLQEAERLGEFLSKNNHGREGWSLAQASQSTHGSDGNPLLVKLDEKGEEKRILYGFVAIASDLDKIEYETRRRLTVRSKTEFGSSAQ